MNCEKCNDLLGPFMDNELEAADAEAVRCHLGVCTGCSEVLEQIAALIDLSREDDISSELVPNKEHMWLRINNLIEGERATAPPPQPSEPPRRFWQFSVAQIAVAALCVAIFSSVITVAILRNSRSVPAAEVLSRAATERTTFEKVLARVGLIESPHEARERLLQERQVTIDYWNARVQSRRMTWDKTTREAFDRNLRIIEQSVNEYTHILQNDPDDELSGEMLNSVLNDKVNLLRDFAEL